MARLGDLFLISSIELSAPGHVARWSLAHDVQDALQSQAHR